MQNYYYNIVMALLMWGFWGFLPKLASRTLDVKSILVYKVIGSLIIGITVLASKKWQLAFEWNGVLTAVLTGVFSILGSLFFLGAVKVDKVSIAAAITAFYPALTIILAFFILNETLSPNRRLASTSAWWLSICSLPESKTAF
ncbi:EamA family transporter [bacterium]|nr:EamA family transporter [bacterium]